MNILEPNTIYHGDCIDVMKTWPDESVHCCVTSPPYWGQRDYGVEGQIGAEETPQEYVGRIVEVFREIKRVLRKDGSVWLVLGDSYVGGGRGANPPESGHWKQGTNKGSLLGPAPIPSGLKPKDLVGIPWRVAFALQADGWWLRSDLVWCLSGGTRLYAKTQKGEMPTTVKDIARLDPTTVKLWNGEKWTQLRGISKSSRKGNEIEIVLRSGERISCTPTHRFPTNRGAIEAGEIKVGDIIESTSLPEPEKPKECIIDEDAAWFSGLYVAEGSRSGRAIQITGHSNTLDRWERIKSIAKKYGGSVTRTIDGNTMNVRVYGRILHSIIDELVSGKTAYDKCFSTVVWRYGNSFIEAMVDGYLEGDGHNDSDNNRWRLGFCRNYNLEASLRTACARLGYSLTLNMSNVPYNGSTNPTFRGELRKKVSNHLNNKNRSEIVEIRKARSRHFYDIGVEDKPHLFALASGVLTHNSKANPMPESVQDRPTKSHEYIFLLTKSQRYFYDLEPIREEPKPHNKGMMRAPKCGPGRPSYKSPSNDSGNVSVKQYDVIKGANKRDVWHVNTQASSETNYACVDEKTEALTSSGWKRYDQLVEGEPIAAYDMETRSIEFVPLKSVASYKVNNQEMVRLNGRGIDQLLTPNHRCLIEHRSGNQSIVHANELKTSHKTLVAATWKKKENVPFPLRLAALVGWYVTEGSGGNEHVYIYQSGDANPQYCDEIRMLLNNEGAEYNEYSRNRVWRGRKVEAVSWRITGSVAHILLGLCPNKHLPVGFLNWNQEALETLWDSLMKGDGHFRSGDRQNFVQKDKHTIDQVQALAVRLGYATTLRKRSEGSWTLYKTESTFRHLQSETSKLITREEYNGVVWCPQTNHTTFVARRGGYTFITGNTFPQKLIEPCILAGTSERGACTQCGAPWKRLMDEGETIGWRPTCNCPGPDGDHPSSECQDYDEWPTDPCLVMDPFMGTGTTAIVAERKGRNWVGIELKEEDVERANKRIQKMRSPLYGRII